MAHEIAFRSTVKWGTLYMLWEEGHFYVRKKKFFAVRPLMSRRTVQEIGRFGGHLIRRCNASWPYPSEALIIGTRR